MVTRIGNGLDLASQRIINLADPTASTDATTKQYVDNAIRGLDWHPSVVAASGSNVALTGAQTIDGIAVTAGQRVLLMAQTTASQNGIWIVASGAWTRPTDYAAATAIDSGAVVTVDEGTSYGGKVYMVTGASAPTFTVDTTSTTWSQLGGGASYTGGNGITVTGTSIAVKAATGGGILVAAGGISVDRSVVPNKYAANVPSGSTSAVVTHNLATTDVTVSVYDITGAQPVLVLTDVQVTSSNSVTLVFATAPTTGQYRVVVTG